MAQYALWVYDRLADRIRLHRQSDRRATIVGEGEADKRLVYRILPESRVVFFSAGSRDIALKTGGTLSQAGFADFSCVVDRDFDDAVARLEGAETPIAAYDDADLEAMLWWTPVLDDFLSEMGSPEKLAGFGGVAAVRKAAIDAVLPLQRLRRANALNGWGLAFDQLDLRRKMNVTSLELRTQAICDALWNPDLAVKKAELYSVAESFPEARCPATGRPLIRGRDALAATGVILRRRAGNLSFQDAHPDRLASVLRLRATEDAITSTCWLKALRSQLGL